MLRSIRRFTSGNRKDPGLLVADVHASAAALGMWNNQIPSGPCMDRVVQMNPMRTTVLERSSAV